LHIALHRLLLPFGLVESGAIGKAVKQIEVGGQLQIDRPRFAGSPRRRIMLKGFAAVGAGLQRRLVFAAGGLN